MNAKEMFEALGYKQTITRTNIVYTKSQSTNDYVEIDFDLARLVCIPRLVIFKDGVAHGYFVVLYPELVAAIHAQMIESKLLGAI